MDYGELWALALVVMATRGAYKIVKSRMKGEAPKFSKYEQIIWWVLIWSGGIMANRIALK